MRPHHWLRQAIHALFVSALLIAGASNLVMAGPGHPGSTSQLAQCVTLGLSTCPQPFDAVLPDPAHMLSWDQHTRVVGFRNTFRQYPADVIHTQGGNAYPLPEANEAMPPVLYKMDGHTYRLKDYLQRQSVTGLLILKNGQRVYEYYGRGNTDKTLWTSRSVAKSVVSVLVGMAIKEGLIGAVDDPITRYLPELKGSAWENVTLRDLLQHTSGVIWNENYADPTSEFAHLTLCEAGSSAYQCVWQLISTLKRQPGISPGQVWSYNTGGAWLVGRILERATGMTIAEYLETRLWSRFAMESDGVWEALVKGQVDMGGHGFNATLRDWGRFALFVAGDGKLSSGQGLLPKEWIAQSVTWSTAKNSVTPATPNGQFGYQWWFNGVDPARADTDNVVKTAQHTFWAEGIYGQTIAINPSENLVMVQWSVWKEADAPTSLYDEQALFFNAVAHALSQTGVPGHPMHR
jgi:CubicO group peptidase (beta-lactamase class C family)